MKTIVGMFDDFQQARTAVEELMRSGVNRDDINLIANDAEGKLKEHTADGHEHTAAKGGAGTGAVLGGLAGLAVGVGALVIPGIGPVITAGTLASALASTAAGAGIGAVAGGVLGALVHVGVPEDEAQSYAEGLRRGGTLVTAKVDDTIAPRAQQILSATTWSMSDNGNRCGDSKAGRATTRKRSRTPAKNCAENASSGTKRAAASR
jgi:uncharacterized membrane protein